VQNGLPLNVVIGLAVLAGLGAIAVTVPFPADLSAYCPGLFNCLQESAIVYPFMSKKNETAVLLLSLVVTLALLAAGLWWVINRSGIKLPGVAGNQSNPGETTPAEPNAPKQPVSDRISAGEKLLISSQATPEKRAAVEAIATGKLPGCCLSAGSRSQK
jgi:hypothetical protein